MTTGMQGGGQNNGAGPYDALAAMVDSAEVLEAGDAGSDGEDAAAFDHRAPDPEPQGGGYRARVLSDLGLPDDIPVIPLGKHGMTHYYLDSLNQLIELSARDHSRNNLSALFAPHNRVLEKYWPRKREVKERDADGNETSKEIITGFSADKCADTMFRAVAARGSVFDPAQSLRGVGCWRREDGSLVWHCGDKVLIDGRVEQPGEFEGYVYPGAPAIQAPAEAGGKKDKRGRDAALKLFDTLMTWNWERGAIDARLMHGWIGSAFLSGALNWRPMTWVTGDAACGKSTLHELVGHVFGSTGLVQTANTTAAGIYQEIGHSALPVAIDELEPEADDKRTSDVIGLARLASSGAVLLRGGKDHKGTQFQARSCFFFSSILIPPINDAERSRMAILNLKRLPPDAKEPKLDVAEWRMVGRLIQRRLLDQWPRLEATLAAYKDAVRKAGHGGRAANQFGTLLAVSWILTTDDVGGVPQEELDEWTRTLDISAWAETRDIKSDADRCLEWLLQASPEAWKGGGRTSVYQMIAELWRETGDSQFNQQVLGQCGLSFVNVRKFGGFYLAVHGNHRGLIEIFRPTRWAGKPGQTGGWVQSLRRLPGAVADHTARIGGKPDKCTLIPVELIMKGTGLDASAETEEKERA